MTKYFCDACGGEIDAKMIGKRLTRDLVIPSKCDLRVEVMVRYNGVWNYGHVCHNCVQRVVLHGDDVLPAAARTDSQEAAW